MSGIKNINVVSGTGNPVQMQDLQNLWSAINSLLRSTKTPISIVAGFATANSSTGTNIGEGIICYQGQAYYLAANSAKIGQYLYANTIQDEQRVYEDGTTRYTYQDYVVNAADNASASGIGTLIGQATATNLASWKVGVLSDGSVTAAMLADGAVTTPKLANGAVTTAKIADGAVGYLQIGTEAIKNGNIQDGQITGDKMANRSIPGSKLVYKTITGAQIADKTITAEKIADATITGTQIAAESITNEEILNYTIDASMKMVPSSVDESCIATAAVGSRQLQVAAVTTTAIKDGSVTGDKLADDTISGEKIADGSIPESKMTAPGVAYLEPTTVVPNEMLSNHELNIIKIGNIGSTHVNAIMPVQQLPGTPVRIFIEHTFSESAVVDIKLSSAGAVAGSINISSTTIGMYAEIFVHDGRVFYWTSGDANYQRE
jgi:hypothetical protein|nr:MAG TPA: hypothetical protein [Caudoviricetes sp.]